MADICTFPIAQIKHWLDSLIGVCCIKHDLDLGGHIDLSTFVSGNFEFGKCVWSLEPWLAVPATLIVASPIGWAIYRTARFKRAK